MSLASWLPETQSAWPEPTMPMTSRSTPGESGPRSTRSPTNTARRPSGWLASTGRPASSRTSVVAQLGEQLLELDQAAVHVADDVERAVLVAEVVISFSRTNDARLDLLDRAEDVDGAEPLTLEALERAPAAGRAAA